MVHGGRGGVTVHQVVEADLTWLGVRFERGVQIAIGDDGRIQAVGRLGRPTTRHLSGRALIPGLVSAHSHAFQRGLRGHGERFPTGAGSFWTWREAMYALVERLDGRPLHRLYLQTFEEMRDAGVTTVGEFHYLHHSRSEPDFAMDQLVLEAAARAGIRIVLLSAYYATGGIGTPLTGAQCRFATPSPEVYWTQMDRLARVLDSATQRLGAGVHSVRAANLDDTAAIHEEATHRQLVFHMHVEEQRREIEECVAAYGKRPMPLLDEKLSIDGGFTAVHCTHTDPEDMARFLAVGGRVCVCPLTEANLGDGIPNLGRPRGLGQRLSLGTDSNARISLLEEMRWLEYGQRLKSESRGVLTADGYSARAVLDAATIGGAQSLGVEAGRISEGHWADLAVIDTSHPSLTGVEPDSLLEALVFGAGNEVIRETCVAGRWRDRAEFGAAGG
jgi:formimidoylglutamate deiminase